MKVRALVTDVDGTITDEENKLHSGAMEAIRRLEGRGISVILASGNSFPVLMTLRKYIGCSGPIIAENGAVIWYNGVLRVLVDPMPVFMAGEVLLKELGNLLEESWQNRYRLADVAFVLKADIPRRRVLELGRRTLEGLPVDFVDSGVAFHIKVGGWNKAMGLKGVAKEYGMDMNEIAAIGDSEVDLELLSEVKISMALAHAPESVRRVATYVTKASYGMGFVEAADWLLSHVG